jgi:hypothetical protein
LLSRKKGTSIFTILKNKAKHGSQTSFKNFLLSNSIISEKRMRVIREKINEQALAPLQEIIKIILPKEY